MLEDRNQGEIKGICTDEILSAIARSSRDGEEESTKRVLKLAVKLRNAFSHGAYIQLDEGMVRATGNVFFKAIQTLYTAGYSHMVHESAFCQYKGRTERGLDGDHLADWREAQSSVSRTLQDYGRLPL